MSILKYLRSYAGRCGVKDGCSTGDCGACTVVVAELNESKLSYKAINSCISRIPYLHGKQLISVEDLADDEHLHPVQQSMVDFHASQCGFCTPGIVMSLFALVKEKPQAGKDDILQTLTGNLCRCTGYRSILKAAASLCAKNFEDKFDRDRESVIRQLNTIQIQKRLQLKGGRQQYFAPTNIDDLAGLLLAHPKAQLLAGGTILVAKTERNSAASDRLIFTGNVAELKAVQTTDDAIVIGAAVPLSDCASRLKAEYEDFGAMLRRFGSTQIRNKGTLGGNIANASPISELLPALIVLGASVTLRRDNKVRCMPVEQFLVAYKATALNASEFIQCVAIPKAKSGFQLKLYKISKRQDIDRAAVFAAFYIQVKDGKVLSVAIAYGGMSDKPERAAHCEKALFKQAWTRNSVMQAMSALDLDFQPISDVRASAAYRLRVAKNLLLKCFVESQTQAENCRVTNYA